MHLVKIGHIIGHHGLKGHLKLDLAPIFRIGPTNSAVLSMMKDEIISENSSSPERAHEDYLYSAEHTHLTPNPSNADLTKSDAPKKKGDSPKFELKKKQPPLLDYLRKKLKKIEISQLFTSHSQEIQEIQLNAIENQKNPQHSYATHKTDDASNVYTRTTPAFFLTSSRISNSASTPTASTSPAKKKEKFELPAPSLRIVGLQNHVVLFAIDGSLCREETAQFIGKELWMESGFLHDAKTIFSPLLLPYSEIINYHVYSVAGNLPAIQSELARRKAKILGNTRNDSQDSNNIDANTRENSIIHYKLTNDATITLACGDYNAAYACKNLGYITEIHNFGASDIIEIAPVFPSLSSNQAAPQILNSADKTKAHLSEENEAPPLLAPFAASTLLGIDRGDRVLFIVNDDFS